MRTRRSPHRTTRLGDLRASATDVLFGRSSAGAGVAEEIACTAAGRAVLDDANAAAQRTTLGAQAVFAEATIATVAVQTTDATVTTDGTYTLADQKVAHVTAKVVALKSDASTGGTWVLEAAFRRNGAGVSQIGTTTLLTATKDVAAATWSATIDASGTDIRIRVTGQAATTINWSASATIRLGP